MKYLFIGLGILLVCVIMIVPISAFMVRQGFANRSKSWAPSAAYSAARIRMRIGRYRTAATILEKAIQTWPRDERVPRAHYWIALCYERLGDSAKAIEWYTRFTTTYPKHMWADQARRRTANVQANQL